MNSKMLLWILAIVLGIPIVIFCAGLWLGYKTGEVLIALFGLVPQ